MADQLFDFDARDGREAQIRDEHDQLVFSVTGLKKQQKQRNRRNSSHKKSLVQIAYPLGCTVKTLTRRRRKG